MGEHAFRMHRATHDPYPFCTSKLALPNVLGLMIRTTGPLLQGSCDSIEEQICFASHGEGSKEEIIQDGIWIVQQHRRPTLSLQLIEVQVA